MERLFLTDQLLAKTKQDACKKEANQGYKNSPLGSVLHVNGAGSHFFSLRDYRSTW